MKIEMGKGLTVYDTKDNIVLDGASISCGCKRPRLIAMDIAVAPNSFISTCKCQNCGNVISVGNERQEDEEEV